MSDLIIVDRPSVMFRLRSCVTLALLGKFVFRQQSELWRLVPPDTTDSLWVSTFRGLGELLHAQRPRPDSDHENYLEMRQIAIDDPLRTFDVEVGQRWRCPVSANDHGWWRAFARPKHSVE